MKKRDPARREPKTVRAGIVGAGFAATFHFECVKRVYDTDVEVAGVFAIGTEQAAIYANKRGSPHQFSQRFVIECCSQIPIR